MTKALILSDGKKGHLNQSIALCRYMDIPYDLLAVRFKNRFFKPLSYLLDRLGIYSSLLFSSSAPQNGYALVVCAGSGTYYAAKTLSKTLGAKSVSMMLPKGYRNDLDLIFAQTHDNPPKQENIVEIPANFSFVEPTGIYKPTNEKAIGIVIGGDNKVFAMSAQAIKEQLDTIKTLYTGYEIAVTTSRRTPKEVERLIEGYGFDYEAVYSKNPVNPIPDFLAQCETVFITIDSTSMISEAISYGQSNVVVLPMASAKESKYIRFVHALAKAGYVSVFDGQRGNSRKKIDFKKYIKSIQK